MCCPVWILFLPFFIRYWGGGRNALAVVTSDHFPFRISILYHLFPFLYSDELRAIESQDKIASAHAALWLPGWKMILLLHAAGAFSTEIGLLPQCRSVQE